MQLGHHINRVAAALDGLSSDRFGAAIGIHLGGVDEIHAEVQAEPERRHLMIAPGAVLSHAPGTEAERRQGDPAASGYAADHAAAVFGVGHRALPYSPEGLRFARRMSQRTATMGSTIIAPTNIYGPAPRAKSTARSNRPRAASPSQANMARGSSPKNTRTSPTAKHHSAILIGFFISGWEIPRIGTPRAND